MRMEGIYGCISGFDNMDAISNSSKHTLYNKRSGQFENAKERFPVRIVTTINLFHNQ